MSRTVLVFSNDLPPLPGQPVSGGGLRVHGLVEGLRSRGHSVMLSLPSVKLDQLPARTAKPFRELAFTPERIDAILRAVDPDVVMLEQWALANFIDDPGRPLVIDLHGSLVVENAYRGHGQLKYHAAAKIKALAKADLLLCAGELQRLYFSSWSILAGFRPDDMPIASVPVLMRPIAEPPPQRGPSRAIIFGGQAWPWVDPFPALEVLTEQLPHHPDYRLTVHVDAPKVQKVLPHDTALAAAPLLERYRALAGGQVSVRGLISHARFMNKVRGACLAFDVFQQNLERNLAFVTRTAEYLACGVPVIHGDYDEIGRWIQEHKAGWVVDPENADQIRDVINIALGNPEELARRARNALRLAQQRLPWDRGIEPLHQFCLQPRARTGGPPVFRQICLDINRIEDEARQTVECEQAREAEWHRHDAAVQRQLEGLKQDVAGRDHTIHQLNTKLEQIRQIRDERQQLLEAGRQQSEAAWQQREAAWQQREAAWQQREASLLQREAARQQREANFLQQEAAWQQCEAAWQQREANWQASEDALVCERDGLAQQLLDRDATRDQLEHELREAREQRGRALREAADARAMAEDIELERARLDHRNLQLQQAHDAVLAEREQLRRWLEDLHDSPVMQVQKGARHALELSTVRVPALASALMQTAHANLYLRYLKRLTGRQVFPGQ